MTSLSSKIIGIDEVGRGCLAGPLLVVAARAHKQLPEGLADSKVLTRQVREDLYEKLILTCDFGEGWVKPSEIDKLGLTAATKLGVKRALRGLGCSYSDQIIIDGNYNYAPRSYNKVETVIDADALIPIVSAASIYAKVKRDGFMRALAARHPHYGFESNVGYGTAAHLAAIKSTGTVAYLHRLSFAPFKLSESLNV
jgi:ribonuclease HII